MNAKTIAISIGAVVLALAGFAILPRFSSNSMDGPGLRISSGNLLPEFSSDIVHYTIRAQDISNPVRIRFNPTNPVKALRVNGQPAEPGVDFEVGHLEAGSRVQVDIETSDGTKNVHSILVLPEDFPGVKITKLDNPQPGYIFLGNYSFATMQDPNPPIGRYLIILDHNATPVWYYKSESPKGDFAVQANGDLTFFEWNTQTYHTIDPISLEIVRSYVSLGEYPVTDNHDLILNEDGTYYIGAKVETTRDLSDVGGDEKAIVLEFVIQKASAEDEILWQWKSWEHFSPDNSTEDYRAAPPAKIDYAHFNSMTVDKNGDLVISNKHMSQIAKIDGESGEIIWKLGAKDGDFRFEDDPLGHFNHQHCARVAPDGNILMYDNGKMHEPSQSRALEYELDFENKVAKLVWSFSYPGMYTEVMGSVQKLENGNTFIGWGGPTTDVTFTEVRPDGSIATEASLTPAGQISYRIQKFDWQPPFLTQEGDTP